MPTHSHRRNFSNGFVSRGFVVVLLAIAFSWWYWRAPPKANTANDTTECPLPPQVASGDEPLQTSTPSGLKPFVRNQHALIPLAGFSVDARVLSREDYRIGADSAISPTDLALGWKHMTEGDVLSQLNITQSNRWYYYSWQNNPPLPVEEIVRSSANMHMIPANDEVAKELAKISKNDRVRIDGWLIEAQMPGGGKWRSSTTREDSGASACEVVYVCAITKH